MSTDCPYCHRAMQQPDPDKGCWQCQPCNIFQALLGYGVSIIYISCEINGLEYSVRLNYKDMETQLTRWEQTADGFAIGKVFLIMPGIINITPSNVVEKIKLYMVFS